MSGPTSDPPEAGPAPLTDVAEAGRDAAAASPAADTDAESEMHPLVQDILIEPSRWRIWPAVALLRWMLRKVARNMRSIVYRSKPSLGFAPSEIDDVALGGEGVELVLAAPGLAAPGSPLPKSDIASIMADGRGGGGLGRWLDSSGDRLMHAVETSQARYNAAFSVATGGRIEAFAAIVHLVGRGAPLAATPGGNLRPIGMTEGWAADDDEFLGAIALSALFLDIPSAAGLRQLMQAFTALPVRVEEFAGAELRMLRPARVGDPMGSPLGSRCWLPAAAVNVVIDGGSDAGALVWAREPQRRIALGLLARCYIGGASPRVRIHLLLDPDIASPAALDGGAAFGGLAVLGRAEQTVRLPLAV